MASHRHPRFPYRGRGERDPVPGAPAVDVAGLVTGYPGGGAAALRGVDLRVPAGARAAIVGPNGAGKSTVLRVLAGILPIQRGEVHIYGLGVGSCHHRVAYLPQRGELQWSFPMTVEQLVCTGRYVHLGWLRRPAAEDREVVRQVLRQLALDGLAKRQLSELSGGQQQRVLLARALAQEAELLLLDEPLNAVDAETRQIVADILDELQRQGRTVLVATHDVGRLEHQFDGALYLAEGRVTPAPPGAFVGEPLAPTTTSTVT
ncbi:MAG: metal ABC transporter ATP-binding protein [Thermoanaerobaculia bacterium]